MQAFVAVVEGQGFSAASRSLGIPLPTVSRWIAELEQQLGAQLLMRSTRKVVVTDSGRQYYESVRRILESLADAEVQAAGEYRSPRGQLTITAPASFGRLHVLPMSAISGLPCGITARCISRICHRSHGGTCRPWCAKWQLTMFIDAVRLARSETFTAPVRLFCSTWVTSVCPKSS